MDIEHDRRIILYPAYLNSKRTVAEGRRIPKDKACEEPNVKEMLAVCTYLKMPAEIENKHYPRDFFNRGRVRVQLKKPDGTLINPTIPTRATLCIRLAELIPKHPERQNRKAAAAAAAAKPIEAAPPPAAAAVASSSSASSTSGSSKKQGGKKKRK